jgi:transposase-like protein
MGHSAIKVIRYFERIRWGDKPKCAYCNSDKLWDRRTDHRFKCRDCNNTFSVTTKTHLHNTKMPLEKWLQAFSIVASAKETVSAKELERQLDVVYPTAFFIKNRIQSLIDKEKGKLDFKADNLLDTFLKVSMNC